MGDPDPTASPDDFVTESREGRHGLLSEFWQWLKHNKKWWLLPILLALALLGAVVLLGGSGLMPFIYPI